MVSRAWIAASFLTILAINSATAQQVVVRSGEHGSFSRLVASLPSRIPWNLDGKGKRWQISFDKNIGEIDTSQAFDRISRDRISSIKKIEGGSGIELDLACSCSLDVSWHGSALLVIDIKDEVKSSLDRNQNSSDNIEHITDPVHLDLMEMMIARAPSELMNSAGKLASKRLEVFDRQGLSYEKGASQEELDIIKKEITNQISQAATSGLLTPDVRSERMEGRGSDSTDANTSKSLDYDVLDPVPSTQLKLETQTVDDIYPQIDKLAYSETMSGQSCIPDGLIDIANWGTEQPFAEQISLARRQITDEFDRYNPDAVITLARLYLYFGFGEEATQVLEAVDQNAKEKSVILSMASIVDYHNTNMTIFNGQMDCNSDAALWSALASTDQFSAKLANTNAMLRTLASYPSHLRSLMGSRLARSFSTRGRPEESARILRLVNRQDEVEKVGETMARAEKDLAMGYVQTAEHAFDDVISQNNHLSAEALVAMIGARLKAREPIEPEVVNLLESYTLEQRGSKIGTQLFNTYIEALAASGDYERAFSLLNSDGPTVDSSAFAEVVETVGHYTAHKASDLPFLRYFLFDDPERRHMFSVALTREVADRLFSLGFYDESEDYLTESRTVSGMATHSLLQAKIDLAKSLPRQALADLISIDGAEADELRARAHSKLGDHQSAHRYYISAGNTDGAVREALLSEAGAGTEDIAGPVKTDAIGREGVDINSKSNGKLARGALLLERSIKARADIVRLLGEVTIPKADDLN